MLNLKNLAKSFGGRQVLHNVSLSCGRKGIIAIMGSSGIGKTTLLNIIAGIESNIDTVLVLSGVTAVEDIDRFPYRPKYVMNGVGDMLK